MDILANTVVTLTFELFDADGVLLEASPEPISYLHGGHSGMLPKVEACVLALRAGVTKTHIIDGRIPHALLLEIYTEAGIGTEIVL